MEKQKIITVQQFSQGFEKSVARVRQLSKDFCEPLDITLFGYVRVYHNGYISWITSNPDQDRFLIESGALDEEPLINTSEVLKEGHYLSFSDRQFSGCETFYHERARLFRVDHSMVVVKHKENYLETCCFSGLIAKRPLYNLFMNEKELFSAFMKHFAEQIDCRFSHLLDEGVTLTDLKNGTGQTLMETEQISSAHRQSLIAVCGWKNLLLLSKREKECLVLFKQGYTYQSIGACLGLSARTVEHYMDSVKNKLGLETRSELYLAAEKLVQLGIP